MAPEVKVWPDTSGAISQNNRSVALELLSLNRPAKAFISIYQVSPIWRPEVHLIVAEVSI